MECSEQVLSELYQIKLTLSVILGILSFLAACFVTRVFLEK